MMTNTEIEALAGSLVSHPRWEWMPGMEGVIYPPEGGTHFYWRVNKPQVALEKDSAPNLRDPATIGCLWHLFMRDVCESEAEWWSGILVEEPTGPVVGKLLYRLWWGKPWE